jgi:hypothetical protein
MLTLGDGELGATMNLPDVIELIVKADSPTDLSGLVFSLVVTSGRKNKYWICFPKTSKEGMAELSANDFRGQFEDHSESGLMDYDGTIESASQRAGIEFRKLFVSTSAF